MKIATKLKLATLVPVLMALVIGFALFFSFKAVQETQRKDRVVHRIITGMNELGGLVGEYALYREERPLQQFLIEHDFILRLIESLRVSHREQAQILQSIRRSVELMKGSFLKLASNHERYGSAQDNGLIREVENRLAGRLLVWSRDVVSDASYLESLVDEQLAATQRTISFLILALIAGTTLFLTVILMGITRNITASLGRLRKGTEVIGAGNLDYRVAMPRKDEIGELSRSFDRMTEQLQAVTVSKNALQQEVEERKKAEAALRESAEKFRIVADFTYDWEYWRSPENRFLYVSPACDRVTGYSREEFIETPDLYPRIIHPEDRGRVEKHLQEDQLHRELCELEFRITCRDGRERWIAHACRPVVDDMGRMLGRRACNRDITERKRTEQNLQESRNELELRVKERTAELERRNKELEDFNYIASHDLQEPLRKIVTFVDLLLHKADLPFSDQNRDYLYRMQKSAARMQALLKSFLDYSRVAKKDTIFTKIELAKSVQASLINLEALIQEKDARVEVQELPALEANPDQMTRVFQNLIGNALKFQRPNEPPRIRIYARAPEPSGSGGAKNYEIYVEDNGVGFEEGKYLEKVFAPFQRLHGRDAFDGVGIGLAICKKIVERHGGSLTVRSTPGKGSLFIITLPEKQGPTH
jgi:PAS domain S-box-containing protein